MNRRDQDSRVLRVWAGSESNDGTAAKKEFRHLYGAELLLRWRKLHLFTQDYTDYLKM